MRTQIINFLHREVKPPEIKFKYNIAIEQYRGVCALLVMVSHGIVHADMLMNKFKWPEFMEYLGAGYLSVILFFCISGYVIGLNYSERAFNVKVYIKKRLIRLYPVYMISLILCISVAGGFTIFTLLENLFFLQNNIPYGNFQVPILVNYVTWSLNYEVIYYLLFIGLFFLRPKVWTLLLCLFGLSLLTINTGLKFQFLGNYINGYYFWLLGLFLAWNLIRGDPDKAPDYVPLLSLLFLHLCQHYLGLGEIILHSIGIYTDGNFNWVFDLPFCLMVMAALTYKNNAFLRFNKLLCYIIPGFIFLYLLIHHRMFENVRWIMCVIYWLLSLTFFFEKNLSARFMKGFTFIGKISYGIYLFHVPMGYLIKRTVIITNRPVEIVVKYGLWFSLTFLLAFLAEIKLQPVVKRYLN